MERLRTRTLISNKDMLHREEEVVSIAVDLIGNGTADADWPRRRLSRLWTQEIDVNKVTNRE